MLEVFDRNLKDGELTALVEEKEKILRKRRFHYRFTVASLLFLSFAAILLFYFFYEDSNFNLIFLALVLIIIYAFSVVWGYKQNSNMFLDSIKELEKTVAFNQATIYKCFADKCASFKNKSLDEPAHFFQVSEGQLFFLSGFDFYQNERFPNTDFEVIAIKGNDGKVVRMELDCKGIFLKPNVVYSDFLKKELREQKKYPENLSVIQGKLENLEMSLFN